MKILANLLDLTNTIATLDNNPFNGYTFEFTPTGELENTFLWRNGHKLDIENNPLALPKQPLIVEASHLEEIELPNDEFEYRFQGIPFTGTALFFNEGKLTSENTFEDGTEIDPDAHYHPNGFLHELNEKEHATSWHSDGVIESQYYPPHSELNYLIQYDRSGAIRTLSISSNSVLDHPLLRSKKFGQKTILVNDGVTNDFLLMISQWGALQDTKNLCISDSNISVEALIKTPLQQLELLRLQDCPNIEPKDIDTLSKLYPNLRIDTEFL